MSASTDGEKPATLIRIAVMGEGAVGKTTLSIQFTVGRFVDYYDPTIQDTYVFLRSLFSFFTNVATPLACSN